MLLKHVLLLLNSRRREACTLVDRCAPLRTDLKVLINLPLQDVRLRLLLFSRFLGAARAAPTSLLAAISLLFKLAFQLLVLHLEYFVALDHGLGCRGDSATLPLSLVYYFGLLYLLILIFLILPI